MPEANLDLFAQRRLPPRPNLEYLKNEAKRRLQALRLTAPAARLADAQHRLAREYGFANWRELKASVDRVACISLPANTVATENDWIGELPGNNRVAMHIRPDGDGFAITMDTPDFGFFGMTADDVIVEERRLSFTLLAPLVMGSYEGFYEARWDAETQAWCGMWTAHGVTTPLDFTRGVYPPSPTLEGLDGFWDSRLESSTGLIRLVLRFKTGRHGTHAWMDSPDRNLLGRPAVSIARQGREVTVTMQTVTVTGTLTADGQWIEGKLTKGEIVVPITLIRRAPGAAAPLPLRAPAVDVPLDVLARYAGRYVTNLGTAVAVSLEDGRLFTQSSKADRQADATPRAGPKLDLFATSPTKFYWRIIDASLEFEVAPDHSVVGYVMRQNGRASRARRVD
jgi:hypothetical protein